MTWIRIDSARLRTAHYPTDHNVWAIVPRHAEQVIVRAERVTVAGRAAWKLTNGATIWAHQAEECHD